MLSPRSQRMFHQCPSFLPLRCARIQPQLPRKPSRSYWGDERTFRGVSGVIEFLFKRSISTPEAFDHLARPCNVLHPTPNGPFGCRASNEGAQVAGLVSKLKNFGSNRLLVRRLRLQSLSVFSWQLFVIGYLGDEIGDVGPKDLSN